MIKKLSLIYYVFDNNDVFVFFQNLKGFIIDLLDFMGFQVQYFYFLMMLNQNSGQQAGQSVRLKQVEMVLEGLRNVIRNNLGECEINILGKYC